MPGRFRILPVFGQASARIRSNKPRPSASTFARALRFESLEDRRVLSLIVPVLNSRLGAPDTIFLDFDGSAAFDWHNRDDSGTLNVKRVHGAGGNDVPVSAFSIDGDAANFSDDDLAGIEAIWKYVAGKYAMFDVNVTTVDPGTLVDGQSMRVLVGGSNSDWWGASNGGVSSIGAYNEGDEDNTCFDWSADAFGPGSISLSDSNLKFIGETAAHEAGHVFGLVHQRAGDGLGNVTDEYYNGDATRVPVMGDSNQAVEFNKNALWWITNMEPGQMSPDSVQDDVAVLHAAGLDFASDDYGFVDTSTYLAVNNYSGQALQPGVINNALDADAFKFVADGPVVQFKVSSYYDGSMLAPDLSLRAYPSFANIAASVTQDTAFSATLTATTLTPGVTYALVVTSRFGMNDMGGYTVTGNVGQFARIDGVTGDVDVLGFGGVDNDITMEVDGSGALVLRDYALGGVSEFRYPAFETPGIYFDLDSGNDTVYFQKIGPIPITFYGGGGTNTLIYSGTNNSDTFDVTGNVAKWTTSGIVTTTTFFDTGVELYGFGGSDFATLRNSWGQAIGFNGGDGYDTLYLTDTANAEGRNWEIHNDTVYHNYGGGQSLVAAYGDVEVVNFTGGAGDDNFLISGNQAVDTFGATQLQIYGQGGYNTITYDDSLGNHADDGYVVTSINPATSRITHTAFDLADYTISDILFGGISSYTLNARLDVGALTEYDVQAVPSGMSLDIFGGPGTEYLALGDAANTLAGIQGPVYFNGGSAGYDQIAINDTGDAVGRTVHIGATLVGAVPGDDLFGSGGYLEYVGLNDAHLTVNLGPGGDTAYVVPNPDVEITVNGNGPAGGAASGGGSGAAGGFDELGLAFAAVDNPVFTPAGTAAGSYTFDNAASLTYSGFEVDTIDDEAPYIITQYYDESVVPTIVVEFSEDVSNSLNVGYLYVFNNTTAEELSNGVVDLYYDPQSNVALFTFPGLPGGMLPPGSYTAYIYGNLTDFYGNSINYETPFGFQVGPLLPGDYNQNGVVDAADYSAWRDTLEAGSTALPNDPTPGVVDESDFLFWRAHFGETSGAGSAAAQAASLSVSLVVVTGPSLPQTDTLPVPEPLPSSAAAAFAPTVTLQSSNVVAPVSTALRPEIVSLLGSLPRSSSLNSAGSAAHVLRPTSIYDGAVESIRARALLAFLADRPGKRHSIDAHASEKWADVWGHHEQFEWGQVSPTESVDAFFGRPLGDELSRLI